MYKVYQVSSQDTWRDIARQFHTTEEILKNLNGTTMLIPGSMIVVPTVEEGEFFTVYTVKRGDSLYEIARKNNTTVDILLSTNGLEKDDYLYPGQELLIPKEGFQMVITREKDTLRGVANRLNTSAQNIWETNENIYLLPDQLLVVKK